MDTVLFTDHGILVFAITCAAAALLLSVLGLATTHRIRSDIIDQFRLEGLSNQLLQLRYSSRLILLVVLSLMNGPHCETNLMQ